MPHSSFHLSLFRDTLRLGPVVALITVQTNLTIVMATGLVGRFGAAAIAGYGIGSRLEYLLVPSVIGFGGPLVALVVKASTVMRWASPAGR
jgi:Na+-driven multidrug efflux pump